MSRRLKAFTLWQLLAAVMARYRQVHPTVDTLDPPLVRLADSKPLVVGGFSKDKEAKRGYATGGMARGYKMLAVWGSSIVPEVFTLAPLNLDDAAGLDAMLEHLHSEGYLLADALHDQNFLHAHAQRLGLQLLTPRKKPGTGLGHRPHEPARLRSIELLEGPHRAFGRDLYSQREQIERELGSLCCFGGGLQPLPSWVRHPRKVTLWVSCKLLINAQRICRNKALAA
jgi:hypothetical protein